MSDENITLINRVTARIEKPADCQFAVNLLANTKFAGGNAGVDLSGRFIDLDFEAITNDKSILTLENVDLGDLSAADFGLSDGIMVIG